MNVSDWLIRSNNARQVSYKILSKHESSVHRVILLEDLIKKLNGTTIDISDYFSEAITCLEHKLYRAAIVYSWSGFFNIFYSKLCREKINEIKIARPKWKNVTLEDLKDYHPESQILDVAKDVKFIKKNRVKIFQGQLTIRNECAHPTLYKPSLNKSIGYVDEMLNQTLDLL